MNGAFRLEGLQSVFSSIENLTAVYLFGSRADGTYYSNSDYDFGLLLTEKPGFQEQSH